MLEVANLSTLIQNQKIIDDVSFNIEPGEVLALIGESGSGKSMTALSIMRLLPTTAIYSQASQISLYGQNLIDLSEKQMRGIRGHDIGMIFQDPMTCLNPVLKIGTQICEVLSIHRHLQGRECYIEALRLLEAVRIPQVVQRFNSYPHELSGGMKQRVMIAMALACRPSLLIADEPTTALDVTTQAEILRLIAELQRAHNMAVLLITHNLAVAAQLADRIAVMQAGKLVEVNSSQKIFNAPQHPYTQKLLDSLPEMLPRAAASVAQSDVVLKVRNLKVYYPIKQGLLRRVVGNVKAVDDLNFDLMAGETLALVGESGCGKTTVGKALLCLLGEAVGEVEFASQNLFDLTAKQLRPMRADIQIIFQDPYAALNPKLRIFDSLKEGLLLQNPDQDQTQLATKLDSLLQQVGLLPKHKWRYPHEFSGGERQRLCIARALAVEPKILVCDEPTSSLDVSIQAQILKLLQDVQVARGLSYLFITHDISVVDLLAHRVAVMYQGKIVEQGLTRDVLNRPQHEYTKTLLAAVPRIATKY